MAAAPEPPTSEEWTVKRVLDLSIGYLRDKGSDSPRLDAEILLAHSCGWKRIQLYTNYDQRLTDSQRGRMRDLVRRRALAEPVAYLVGYREFFSLNFDVNPAVLIPRPDTETLVRVALDALKERSAPTALDIGTGSGCIAIAIATNFPGVTLTATDISADALQTATANAEKHKVTERIAFLQSDVFESVPGTKFDIIVSNPPYIREDELAGLDADVRDHEPVHALVGGADGLDVVRRIIKGAPEYLTPDGCLMFEVDGQQAETVREFMSSSGFTDTAIEKDLSGIPRVVSGKRQ